jgi:hypothetical protein
MDYVDREFQNFQKLEVCKSQTAREIGTENYGSGISH